MALTWKYMPRYPLEHIASQTDAKIMSSMAAANIADLYMMLSGISVPGVGPGMEILSVQMEGIMQNAGMSLADTKKLLLDVETMIHMIQAGVSKAELETRVQDTDVALNMAQPGISRAELESRISDVAILHWMG